MIPFPLDGRALIVIALMAVGLLSRSLLREPWQISLASHSPSSGDWWELSRTGFEEGLTSSSPL